MAKTSEIESLRAHLRDMREEIGTREEVGRLMERSERSIAYYEAKAGPLPLWYRIVIPELWKRHRAELAKRQQRT